MEKSLAADGESLENRWPDFPDPAVPQGVDYGTGDWAITGFPTVPRLHVGRRIRELLPDRHPRKGVFGNFGL